MDSATSTSNNQNKEGGIRLARNLGLANGVAMMLSVVIGSGIFVSPKGVLLDAGSVGASLLVWTLCGLFCLLGALCLAELATSIRSSGGEYTYIRLAYGPLPAFLYLWVTFTIIMPCSNAISALTFAKYVLQPLYLGGSRLCSTLVDLLPVGALLATAPPAGVNGTGVGPSNNQSADIVEQPPDELVQLLALLLLLLLTYVNCTSVRLSIKIQNSLALAKVFALVLVISLGLLGLIRNEPADKGPRNFQSWSALWQGTQTSAPHLAQALYAAFYTYAGWNSLNCVTEEMKDPVKNMPRAIILSIASITLIYILTNVAYFAVLSKSEILQSDAIGVLFGQRAIQSAPWLMPLAVALSTIGGLNSSLFSSSRILFAGARERQLPSALSALHHSRLTPIPALLLLGALSMLYLFTTKILVLINHMIFIEASFAALGVSTVLKLRQKYPNIERPLRIATLIPLLYLLFSLFLILLPVWSSPGEALIGLVITLSGVPVFYATANWSVKPTGYRASIDRFNCFIQRLTASLIPLQDHQIESDCRRSQAKPSS